MKANQTKPVHVVITHKEGYSQFRAKQDKGREYNGGEAWFSNPNERIDKASIESRKARAQAVGRIMASVSYQFANSPLTVEFLG